MNYTITFDFNTKIRCVFSKSSFRYSNYINIVIQNLCCEHINSMTFVVVCICLRFIPKNMPSVLWRCWLDGRKGIRPVKTEWWGAGVVICLEQGVDLHMAQLMPLPLAVPCFSKIQTGFAFLVPAHPGSPRQRAFKRVCVLYKKNSCIQFCLKSQKKYLLKYMIKFIQARKAVIQAERHSVMHITRPVRAGWIRIHVVNICTHMLMLYTLNKYFHFYRKHRQYANITYTDCPINLFTLNHSRDNRKIRN